MTLKLAADLTSARIARSFVGAVAGEVPFLVAVEALDIFHVHQPGLLRRPVYAKNTIHNITCC